MTAPDPRAEERIEASAELKRPSRVRRERPEPSWICGPCGNKYGRVKCGVATWHFGICGVCGEQASVTEPRDFGHLKPGWDRRARAKFPPRKETQDG